MLAVRALLSAAEEAGASRAEFLAACELTPAQLADADARISLADYARVRRAALQASGDPALGLHMGERPNTASFDVLGHLAEHGQSLRETLRMIARYAAIIMLDGPQLELCETYDSAVIRWSLLKDELPETQLTAEFVTSSVLFLVRRFIGASVMARQVFFAYRAPLHRAEYTRVFLGRERFEHDFTGIELPRAWLDREPVYRSAELCSLLQTRAEQLLARVDHDAPMAERVRRWLASQNSANRPTMDLAARGLGMSARSLRRRLVEERARYDELLEESLSLRAKSLLADSRNSVQEAAYALGFATPAAFSRAFKRWTGVAPSAFRAAQAS